MPERDRQLLKRIHAGERRAEEEFVREWYPRIAGWVAQATSADKVEDYTQAVMLHLADPGWRPLLRWQGLEANDTDNPNSLAAFLRTVTRRKVIDLYRADHPERFEPLGPDEIPADDGDQPQRLKAREQFKLAFRSCFARLQRKDQRMLIMRLQERSDEEIAEKFGRSKDSVRQRRSAAYKLLRKCLAALAPGQFGDE